MTFKKKTPPAPASECCAHVHPDDGQPIQAPKELRTDPSQDRKTLQLCAQVRRALQGVIPITSDPRFEGIDVAWVKPDPDATKLQVGLTLPPDRLADIVYLKQRLTSLKGYLRSEIASQINRKRVPLLTFEFQPRMEDAS